MSELSFKRVVKGAIRLPDSGRAVQVVQGDILLRPVTDLGHVSRFTHLGDERATLRLGYGEQTGHEHLLANARWLVEAVGDINADRLAPALERFAVDGESSDIRRAYVLVSEDTVLSHLDGSGQPTPDHEALPVAPGLYEVIRQSVSIAGVLAPVRD